MPTGSSSWAIGVSRVRKTPRWLQILAGLCQRAGRQVELGVMQQMISQLPRVEQRILRFLWSLADRWGQMHPNGARITQPFTHRELGRIVGASRPTVSLGLKSLTDPGMVRVEDEHWILSRSSVAVFDDVAEPPTGPSPGERTSPTVTKPLDAGAAIAAQRAR